jgi:predicted HicB family RNase H-like nuclease
MKKRTYFAPDSLYEAAMAKAAQEQKNLSDVIREALERYVKRK